MNIINQIRNKLLWKFLYIKYYTFKNFTDYNRQVTIGDLMKKLVKIGVDGETIGKIIDATTDDQPEGVSISNDKIGKLLIINILTYSKTIKYNRL